MLLLPVIIVSISPTEDAEILWKSYGSDDGVTAETLLPCPRTDDTAESIKPEILPEEDYLDLAGRRAAMVETGSFPAGSNSIPFSTTLPAGIYSVTFSAPDVSLTGRFVVVR